MRELAWAAGLFEGEGCFAFKKDSAPRALAQIQMTDEDAVRRFHQAVGIGSVSGPRSYGDRRPSWVWNVQSNEEFQAIVAMLWYGLGQRRREKAREILAAVRPHMRPRRGRSLCRRGHSDWYQRPDGGRRCRPCTLERVRDWVMANPDKRREAVRRYNAKRRSATWH